MISYLKIYFIILGLFSTQLFADNFSIKDIEDKELSAIMQTFGYCHQFDIIYKKGLKIKNESFIQSILDNDSETSAACSDFSKTLEDQIKITKEIRTEKPKIYYLNYLKGLCKLANNLDYIKDEKDFVLETRKYFMNNFVSFKTFNPEIVKYHNLKIEYQEQTVVKPIKITLIMLL